MADSGSLLQDVYITSKKNGMYVDFNFQSSKLPKFFQKSNPAEKKWIVGFLMTSFEAKEGLLTSPKTFPMLQEVEILTTRRKGKKGIRNFLEFHFKLSETKRRPDFKFKKSGGNQIQFVWNEKFSQLAEWEIPADKITASPVNARSEEAVKIQETQEEPPLEEILGTKSAYEIGAEIDSNKGNTKGTFSPIPKPKSMTVIGDDAKIYRRNTVKSELLKHAEPGDLYYQVKETKVFAGILLEEDTAYIKKSALKPSDKLTEADRQKIKSHHKNTVLAKQKKEKEVQERLEKESKKRAEELRRQQEARKRQTELVRLEQENQMALMLAQKQREQELKEEQSHLKNQVIIYSSFGRRDPFIPVVQSEINEDDFNIDQMQLVGIIWDSKDPLAVLEHRMEPGISITLRSGDKISNGKVSEISHEKVTFEILEFGVYRNYTLKLTQKEK